jgi:hypothetical protein
MKFSVSCLSLALYIPACQGFAPMHTSQMLSPAKKQLTSSSSTELYIIGPMIRKMREEQTNKNRPLAFKEDIDREAPGLKVGSKSWKWPPVWPYSDDYFIPKEDIPKSKNAPPSVAGLMNGNLPKTNELEEESAPKLDPLNYWSVEKAMESTDIDPQAAEKLTE